MDRCRKKCCHLRPRISCRRDVLAASCVSCVGSGTKFSPEFHSGAVRERVQRVREWTGSAAFRSGVRGRAAADQKRRCGPYVDVPP